MYVLYIYVEQVKKVARKLFIDNRKSRVWKSLEKESTPFDTTGFVGVFFKCNRYWLPLLFL